MKTKHYTPDGQHPEDAICKAKTFINELQKVQENYFAELTQKLKLTKEGEDWLFDYIYNSDEEYDGFDHYLEEFKKDYDDMVVNDTLYNSNDVFLPTDFGEFSPMTCMSSYEPELETSFPYTYNDKEPFSLGLESATIHIKNDKTTNCY